MENVTSYYVLIDGEGSCENKIWMHLFVILCQLIMLLSLKETVNFRRLAFFDRCLKVLWYFHVKSIIVIDPIFMLPHEISGKKKHLVPNAALTNQFSWFQGIWLRHILGSKQCRQSFSRGFTWIGWQKGKIF